MGFRPPTPVCPTRLSGLLEPRSGPRRRPLYLWLLALLCAVSGQAQPANTPSAALPVFSSDETLSFLNVELGDGRATVFDRLRRNPLAPRAERSANVFDRIGRPKEPPAKVGEILFGPIINSAGTVRSALFVESSTGYVAYFDQLNKGFGTLDNALGRPFGPIAAADGNFALLMRRDGTGRSVGAYLYHATTGRALYLSDVDKLAAEPAVAETEPLPRLDGPLASVALVDGNQETYAYLLLDAATGSIHVAGLIAAAPQRFETVQLEVDLRQLFGSPEAPAELGRLTAVGLQNSDGATAQVLILDPKSGAMALIDDLPALPARVSITRSERNFYTGLSGENPDGRVFTPVPHHDGDGLTLGVWLWDSARRTLLYLANPASLDSATPRRVRTGG